MNFTQISYCLFLSILFSGFVNAQSTLIEYAYSNGSHLFLVENFTQKGERHSLSFVKTNRNYQDSVIYHLDTINVIPCGHINSMHFINDSVGFITESGGCYAYYNYLFRTEDAGKSWKAVEIQVGNEFEAVLNEDHFFMFDEKNGMIIWKVDNRKVYYSVSSDGGKSWKTKTFSLDADESYRYLTGIHFSKGGQIILVVSSEFAGIKSRTNSLLVFQSLDFGKTFKKMN